MIDGLRLLPWVLYHRREEKQPTYCDCDECPEVETTRIQLGCGKLPASKRGEFQRPVCFPGEDGICPGYLVSLPQVLETARLHPWFERGQLAIRLGGQPTAMAMDCLDILQGAINGVEAHATRPRD